MNSPIREVVSVAAVSELDIRSFKDLDIWRVSMALCTACYRATASFPRDEIFGLTSQIRRAAVSIPANIAEGYGRETTASYIQFLRISQGSLKELETLLLVAEDVELLADMKATALLGEADRISRMLRNFIRALERK